MEAELYMAGALFQASLPSVSLPTQEELVCQLYV